MNFHPGWTFPVHQENVSALRACPLPRPSARAQFFERRRTYSETNPHKGDVMATYLLFGTMNPESARAINAQRTTMRSR